jgi:glycosyltransferase involved in cell wall biosynthesis
MNILILLNNSFINDSRVQRTVKTLSSKKENKILLLCIHKNEKGIKKYEKYNNLIVRRMFFYELFPFRRSSIKFHMNKSLGFIFKKIIHIFINKESKIHKNLIYQKASKKKYINNIFESLVRKLITNFFWFFETEFYTKLFMYEGVKFNPDIVHCNDLSTLLAGYSISKKCNSKLIYDSHELELDRNSSFNRLIKFKRYLTEKFLIKKCHQVITVSESIADYLKDFYKINKPVVIYNSPDKPRAKINFHIENFVKDWEFYKSKKIVIYIGLVTFNRGIEEFLDSYNYLNDNFCFFILGPVNQKFFNSISDKYKNLIDNKSILFIKPLKKELVIPFSKFADVSILPIQNACLSYNFCFPNKLLESVYSNLPIAAANLVELSSFVKRYKCGLVFNEKDPSDIAKKIKLIVANTLKYKISNSDKKEIDKVYSARTQHLKLLEIYENIKLNDTRIA